MSSYYVQFKYACLSCPTNYVRIFSKKQIENLDKIRGVINKRFPSWTIDRLVSNYRFNVDSYSSMAAREYQWVLTVAVSQVTGDETDVNDDDPKETRYPKVTLKSRNEKEKNVIYRENMVRVNLSDVDIISTRRSGEFNGVGTWLNDMYDWEIVTDSTGELVLVATKKYLP